MKFSVYILAYDLKGLFLHPPGLLRLAMTAEDAYSRVFIGPWILSLPSKTQTSRALVNFLLLL